MKRAMSHCAMLFTEDVRVTISSLQCGHCIWTGIRDTRTSVATTTTCPGTIGGGGIGPGAPPTDWEFG